MVFNTEDSLFEGIAQYSAALALQYNMSDLDAVTLVNNIKCFMSDYANLLDNGKITTPIQQNDAAALDNINEVLGKEI